MHFLQVVNGVQMLVVPVLIILQARVDKSQSSSQQQNYSGLDAQTLEEVRNDWCALVGDTDASSEASTIISDVIPMILLDSPSINNIVARPSKNRECIDQNADLNLSARYTEAIEKFIQNTNKSTPLQPTNLNRQTTEQTQCEP